MSTSSPQETDRPPTPIGFKLLVAMAVLYLGYRLAQGIIWLIERF